MPASQQDAICTTSPQLLSCCFCTADVQHLDALLSQHTTQRDVHMTNLWVMLETFKPLIVLIMYAELDDYLDLARAGPALSDEQHIYHKLIFDAVNEAINKCIVDVSSQPQSPSLKHV